MTKCDRFAKTIYIARGAVAAERTKSNPKNLIRVMPAKGSGLLVAIKLEHNLLQTDGLYAAFHILGSGFFLLYHNDYEN